MSRRNGDVNINIEHEATARALAGMSLAGQQSFARAAARQGLVASSAGAGRSSGTGRAINITSRTGTSRALVTISESGRSRDSRQTHGTSHRSHGGSVGRPGARSSAAGNRNSTRVGEGAAFVMAVAEEVSRQGGGSRQGSSNQQRGSRANSRNQVARYGDTQRGAAEGGFGARIPSTGGSRRPSSRGRSSNQLVPHTGAGRSRRTTTGALTTIPEGRSRRHPRSCTCCHHHSRPQVNIVNCGWPGPVWYGPVWYGPYRRRRRTRSGYWEEYWW